MITQQPLALAKTIIAIGPKYLNFEVCENLQTLTLQMFL